MGPPVFEDYELKVIFGLPAKKRFLGWKTKILIKSRYFGKWRYKLKNKEIEKLISEIEKARSSKQKFDIYANSKIAITEVEYFLIEATAKFRDLQKIKNDYKRYKHHFLQKENLAIRSNVLESVQKKIKIFNLLRRKIYELNLHAAKVSVLYMKDDLVVDRIWQEGIASASKDLNSLIWPPKLRKVKAKSVKFIDFVKILELQIALSKANKLNEGSAGAILDALYFIEENEKNGSERKYINYRKQRFFEDLKESTDSQEATNFLVKFFSKSKSASRADAAHFYLKKNPGLSTLSSRNVENSISKMIKSFNIDKSADSQKLLLLYLKYYWTDFVKNRSRPTSIKYWSGISI